MLRGGLLALLALSSGLLAEVPAYKVETSFGQEDFNVVTGLGEMVSGCMQIPITVDSKGEFYLASSEKSCIVKCVPDASVTR